MICAWTKFYSDGCKMMIFLIPSFLLYLFYHKKEFSLHCHLFMCLHIINMSSLFYSTDYNPLLCLFILVLRSDQIWPVGARSKLTPCLLDTPRSHCWARLTFCCKMFQAHLYLPCPSPRIRHLSIELWFLLVKNGF